MRSTLIYSTLILTHFLAMGWCSFWKLQHFHRCAQVNEWMVLPNQITISATYTRASTLILIPCCILISVNVFYLRRDTQHKHAFPSLLNSSDVRSVRLATHPFNYSSSSSSTTFVSLFQSFKRSLVVLAVHASVCLNMFLSVRCLFK